MKAHDEHQTENRQSVMEGTAARRHADAPATAATAGLQDLADGSSRTTQLKQLAALAGTAPGSGRMRQLQRMADDSPRAEQRWPGGAAPVSPTAAHEEQPNRTGLPDQLKSGIEALSGMSMDHVKVHYNSDKPAQLQAHAYAQGSEIHLAPGQEGHLPHEAWHVVQQAQGRVRATTQLKGNIGVNDDAGLEAEADAIGAKAAAMPPLLQHQPLRPGAGSGSAIAQRVVSVSALKYIPAAADLVFLNALDAQVAAAETAASNDVQNNPAPHVHSVHQAAYMRQPSARAWGNCVEEKLNVWAIANGWTTQNNGSNSNPDYSRMNGGTKIWADLTTAAEAGAGASHIIDKLDRKVALGADDTGWVAADIVHNNLHPLANQPAVAPITNGAVTAAHRTAWQSYKSYKDRAAEYDDVMVRRAVAAGPLPGYATYTQSWDATRRNAFAAWINGDNDDQLEEESDDDISDSELDFDEDRDDEPSDDEPRKRRKRRHHGARDTGTVLLDQ